MVQAIANSNFQLLGKQAQVKEQDPDYLKYRQAWHENPANFFVEDFPLHLDVEISSRCNLSCTFCDKQPLLKSGKSGDMEFSIFKKIIDQAGMFKLKGLKLSYRGEPLLHPKIAEMVSYAKQKGVLDLYFNTNGMLLTQTMSSALIDAGLDRISISIDGIDAKLFNKMRKGADFKTILTNIESLGKLKDNKGVKHPEIRIQTVNLPDLDLEKYIKFWQPYCDEVAAIDYKDVQSRVYDRVEPDWACPQLWQRMTIEWDGTILACNNDDFRKLSVGNIKQTSLHAGWHNTIVENARRFHQNGESHLVEACNGCPWRTAQTNKPQKSNFSKSPR
jgi:radical SAM protein with 4Fe4S-binding SPASM domain